MPGLFVCVALAAGFRLPSLRGQWPGDPSRFVALPSMWSGNFGVGRDDFPRQQTALASLVSGDVAGDVSEERHQCPGLQRVLGLGNYRTAWAMLHKLRRAMVRPGRDRLSGVVEADEAYWGAEESGVGGRQSVRKALIIVAAQADGKGIGRIRLRHIPDTNGVTLHGFIAEAIEPGSTVVSDGLQAYRELERYIHQRQIPKYQPEEAEHLLVRVHRVISLLKRWLLGTPQGAIAHEYLQNYLDEFTFRFNRRKSASRGKLFYRLAQQAVQVSPVPFDSLSHSKQ